MTIFNHLDEFVRDAIVQFWNIRYEQIEKQKASNKRDAGLRGAVTGGKQMSGFEKIAADIALEKGFSQDCIYYASSLDLPGYFRPEKKWDLLIVDNNVLVAAIEFKSQVGPSFGNNFNNRTEEAIGTANDLWTAYREGVFGNQIKPWLGYLFVLEEHEKSTCSIRLKESHFSVFEDFRASDYTKKNKKGVSYAKRYEILLTKLIKERFYDAGCLILSRYTQPPSYIYPSHLLIAQRFFSHFAGHLEAHINSK